MNEHIIHDRAIHHIHLNPRKTLGLEDVVLAGEVCVFNDNQRLISKPDGFIIDKKGGLYVFEYQTTQNDKKRALRQLETTKNRLFQVFHKKPKLYYVTGEKNKYEVVEINTK